MPESISQVSPNRQPVISAVSPTGSETLSRTQTAWDLTRRLVLRDQVHVMKRDAYGQLSENSYPGRFRVGPVAPTMPWCIDLADESGLFRLLCFDFDGKAGGVVDPDLMEQAGDDCDALSEILTGLGIAHVVCESSGTGGRHLWVGLAGLPADDMKTLARAAQANYPLTLDFGLLMNSRTGAVRPPLSPHRDGSYSSVLRGDTDALLSPSTTTDEISALTAALTERMPAPRRADSTPEGVVDLSHRGHRRLSAAGAAHMATLGGGSNPSKTGFLCLLSAANAGWTLRDVEHAAKTAPGMEHYRTRNIGNGKRRRRSADEATRRLERQWAKAVSWAAVQRPLPSPTEPRDLTELAEIIDAVSDLLDRFRVNPGRWGATEAASNDQSILSAIAYLTLQTSKPIVAASIRDLALMTGLGRTTAARSLQALTEAGFVALETPATDANAAEWRLQKNRFSTAPGTVRSQPLDNPRPRGEIFSTRAVLISRLETQLTDQRHDLFTRTGLGHLAGKLYALLRQHPELTRDDAAKRLGVGPRYVTKILSRLRLFKLIVKSGDGWRQSKLDLRTKAAEILGVAGILVDRARNYKIERETWIWWLTEFDRMHTKPQKRPRRRHVTARPIFEAAERPGERSWPTYPRDSDGTANHKDARYLISVGALEPEARWKYLGDAA